MNWWAVVIIVFAVALLPWQIFRHARRKNDSLTKVAKPRPAEREDSEGFW